jgi:hypothetical protein
MKQNKAVFYMCEIYESRPDHCEGYPWNFANDIFPNCIFYDVENDSLRTMEEQLEINTEMEIIEACCRCGDCCRYWENGKAIHKCHKLKTIVVDESG